MTPTGTLCHLGLATLLLAAAGCGEANPLPPAPEDLHGNARWFWSHQLDASDAEVADAAEKLLLLLGETAPGQPLRGELPKLTAGELEGLNVDPALNPAQARGIYVATALPCTLAQVEALVVSADQQDLHPGVYDRFERSYTTDLDAFVTGKHAHLSWRSQIDARILTSEFTHTLHSTLRRAGPVANAPYGNSALLLRAWQPEPAAFKSSTTRLPQNYELEVFLERSPHQVLHLYGVWRQVDIVDLGLSTKDNNLANAIAENLLAWDAQTAKHCGQ